MRILITLLLSCFWGAHVLGQNSITPRFKVLEVNSDRIKVNGKIATPGMVFPEKSKISFSNDKEEILVMPLTNYKYFCKTHNQSEEWRYGEKRKIRKNKSNSPVDWTWWLINHQTVSKGINGISDTLYLIGKSRCFEIEDIVRPEANEYYEFIITEGKHEGTTFKADRDDTDPVIWIDRKFFPDDEESYVITIRHHYYDHIDTICSGVKIYLIK